MKGIILAGGKGLRLFPATAAVSKHLLPVYDKPMIYYPLSTLLGAGIREILLVVSPESLEDYRRLLGDGSRLGIRLRYQVQGEPRGIGHGLTLVEDYVNQEPVCVILGDNLFLGANPITPDMTQICGCTVFGCSVENPWEYGVAELDGGQKVVSVEEKPLVPKSHIAITGLYLFDGQVCRIAKDMAASARGEYEICDILGQYLKQESLGLKMLGEETAWIDAGTPDRLLSASCLVQSMQERTKTRLACVEETAWRQGLLTTGELAALAEAHGDTAYGQYLRTLAEGETT